MVTPEHELGLKPQKIVVRSRVERDDDDEAGANCPPRRDTDALGSACGEVALVAVDHDDHDDEDRDLERGVEEVRKVDELVEVVPIRTGRFTLRLHDECAGQIGGEHRDEEGRQDRDDPGDDAGGDDEGDGWTPTTSRASISR